MDLFRVNFFCGATFFWGAIGWVARVLSINNRSIGGGLSLLLARSNGCWEV